MDPKNLLDYLGLVPDPRVERTQRHDLQNVFFIALGAVICGADGPTEMEAFGKANLEWLGSFLELTHGIPSHDTFGRVFAALDPDALETALGAFVRDFAGDSGGNTSPSTGKPCATALTRRSRRAPSTWSRHGSTRTTPPSARSRWTTNPTKLPPSPNCWPC